MRLGCVIVAPLAAGAACREIVADDGPGFAAPATWGPALAGTSPTVVTTLVTASLAWRLFVATPVCAAVTGESIVAEPLDVDRRTSVGVLAGSLDAEATCDGTGSPARRAVAALSVACRRVAMLVGETSMAEVLVTIAPVAASATCDVLGTLGAPLRRVRVAAADGLVEAVGPSRPWVRASWADGCEATVERGSLAGISAGRADVTCIVARAMRLASADASMAVGEVMPGEALGVAVAAVVATSGRAVLRGWRLATGEGLAATAAGCGSAGLSRR